MALRTRPGLPRAERPALNARSKAIQAVLDNVAAEVDTLPHTSLREVGTLLRDAKLELEAGLREWLASAEPEADFTRAQWLNALVQLRGALEAVDDLEPGLTDILRKGEGVAAALAVRHVQYELQRFGAIFHHEIKPIPLLPASKLIINKGARTRMVRVERSAKRYAGRVGQDIRAQLARGMIKGETNAQIVKRLIGPGARIKLGKIDILPDASGPISERMFRRYENWARTIVRTEVINAYNDVANDSIEEAHKIDHAIMRRWDATLDARVCPFCRELDGQVVKIGEAFRDGIEAPPAHPNCRCAVLAWRADWEEHAR